MITLFLMPPVFAAGSETLDTLNFLKNALLRIGDLASWLWILLGNIAGVLMTNTLVYAEFMGLDSFLWKVWQMMRTIANYAI